MFKKNLFTIFGFKLVWLSCIFGELYFGSFLGFVVGLLFLFSFFIINKNISKNFKIIFFFSLSGYIFDSVLSFFELYQINSKINFLFLPLWFLVLWPSFCCLLIDVLKFLRNKKFFSLTLGAFFGPLSYYVGVTSGLASAAGVVTFLLLSIFWSLLMFFYSTLKF